MIAWLKKLFHVIWPFSSRKESKDATDKFQQMLQEANDRDADLHSAAQKLKDARKNIHKRARELQPSSPGFGKP